MKKNSLNRLGISIRNLKYGIMLETFSIKLKVD